MKQSKLIFSLFFLFLSFALLAQQTDEVKRRDVVLNYPDSILKFQVMITPKNVTAGDLLQYFWYDSDKLKSKKGSYSGKLLDGKFNVYDLQNNLIVEGFFADGLQHGVWKRWNSERILIRQGEWKNGKRNGALEIFDNKGKKVLYEEYLEGLRHGKQIAIINGEERISYFLKGEKTDKESFEKQRE